jgi:hypothetical protein
MKQLFLLALCFLFCTLAWAQEPAPATTYRSDSTRYSILLRYYFIAYAAGIELPQRNHSFSVLWGQFSRFEGGGMDLNRNTMLATDYKRYFTRTPASGSQPYVGSYLLLLQTRHANGDIYEWTGQWISSRTAALGPLLGWKWYTDKSGYLELYAGVHRGIRSGQQRWGDNAAPDPAMHIRHEKATDYPWGYRLGFQVGVHLPKRASRPTN